jgi:hypothetical protein
VCACRKRAQSIAERQADDEGRVDRVERIWFEIRERENSGLSVELMAARPEITFRKWKLSSERNQRGVGDTSWRLMPPIMRGELRLPRIRQQWCKKSPCGNMPVSSSCSAHCVRSCVCAAVRDSACHFTEWIIGLLVNASFLTARRAGGTQALLCRLAILAVAAMVWLISPFCDWYLQSPARNRSQNFQSSQQGAGTCQSLSDYIGSCRSRWAL